MSTSNTQSTPGLVDFLERSGARYRAFDLGSQLRNLSREQFARFDQGQPYPYPHLSHAWLILLLWNPEQREQHSIWFMKLPLDEQGGLPAAVMTDVLDRLYRSLATADAEERQRLLTDHPYQFTPPDNKMAALHARASRTLGAPPSSFHPEAHRLLTMGGTAEDWAGVGLQGLFDALERRSPADEQALSRQLPDLPDFVRHQVLNAFEHHQPGVALTECIIRLARHHQDVATRVATLRALSLSPSAGMVEAFVSDSLNQFADELDVVLAVLSRHPGLLANTDLALAALDRLAVLADTDGFNRVVQGLALQPNLSGLILQALRHPHRSNALAQAIGHLINSTRTLQ
ncbi:DUF3549 family protein [Saccharospirillum impatiens]|uniref:DUF3549 family protein n=1 Tax=Saccharospirillum impatiens TaxID=169438 RepID=UPI000423998A|nr:DUF3549 family protein [Saccharospirillum impatiens]